MPVRARSLPALVLACAVLTLTSCAGVAHPAARGPAHPAAGKAHAPAPSAAAPTHPASETSSGSVSASALTCSAALAAARDAYPDLGAVTDVTAQIQPHTPGMNILRSCTIEVDGQTIPLVIEFRAESRTAYDAEVKVAKAHDAAMTPVDGKDFGDAAYVVKNFDAPGYGLQAWVNDIHVSVVGPLPDQDTKNITQSVIVRML